MLKSKVMRVIIISLVSVLVATVAVFVAARNINNHKPSPTPVQTEKTELKACNLVATDDIKAVLGAEARFLENEVRGGSVCVAVTEDKTISIMVQDSKAVIKYTDGDMTSTAAFYEDLFAKTSSPVKVEGIGDKAFWDGSQIRVLKGDYLVSIVYDDQTKAQNLVKKILPKLQP